MRVSLAWFLAVVAGCGFHPAGGGDDDVNPPGDGPPGGDAADAGDVDPTDGPDPDAPIDAAIDAPIDAPPPACPGSYNIVTSTGRYSFRPIAAQHAAAQADCNDDAAGRTHLATFESPGSFDDDLATINPGNSALPFIGASCGDIDCDNPDNWRWTTGVRVDDTLWEDSEPGGLAQTIASAIRNGGVWRVQSMSALETRPYICECD